MLSEFSVTDTALSGWNLVEASAGTGKTYAIETLFVRFLLEQQRRVPQILVVTFTEAATAELKERVRKRLLQSLATCERLDEPGSEPAEAEESDPVLVTILSAQRSLPNARRALVTALQDFDNASIFTIHGFCQRVLRDHAFLTKAPFEAELLSDTRPLVDDAIADFLSVYLLNVPVPVIASLRNQGLAAGEIALRNFANRVAHLRNVTVLKLPEKTPDFSVIQDFLALKAQLRNVFNKTEFHQWVSRLPINRSRYQDRHVVGRLDEIEAFANGTDIATYPGDKLKSFSAAALTAALKAGAGPLPKHPVVDACTDLAECYLQLEGLLNQSQAQLLDALLQSIQRRVAEQKLAHNQLSFDDLLLRLDQALSGAPQSLPKVLRERYPVALLDEFQDTDPVQLSIFEKIYPPESAVFLIGDPKQAIYSFRGADLFTYLRAAHQIPRSRRYTLAVNRRSDEALVQAVNALFSGTRPFLFEEPEYPDVRALAREQSALAVAQPLPQAPFVFRLVEEGEGNSRLDPRVLAEHAACEILTLITSGCSLSGRSITPKDIAVLTRTNKEAFECQAALARRRIPSVVLGDRSVYEYDEARELQLVLAGILEPGSPQRVRAALSTELLGASAEQLLNLNEDDRGWQGWLELFRDLHVRWVGQGFVQMIRRLLSVTDVTARLMRLHDGERRMTNLLHLIELLHTEAKENHWGPTGIYAYLSAQRNRPYAQSDSEQIRLESDEDAVILTTIHKSKGLEYPIVLCPFLSSAILDLPSDKFIVQFHAKDGERCLDLGSPDQDEHRKQMRAEAFAENLRLLYVALTRAKHRLIAFWGRFKSFETSALGYLLCRHAQTDLPVVAALAEHEDAVKQLSSDDLRSALERLCVRAPGVAIGAPLSLPEQDVYRPEEVSARELQCRQASLKGLTLVRTTSFTELTAAAHQEFTGTPPEYARDRDLFTTNLHENAQAATPIALATFPAGANVGNCFHAVFEQADFQLPLPPELAKSLLTTHGLDPALSSAVSDAFDVMRNTELETGLQLSKVPPAQRLVELEFLLPLAAERKAVNTSVAAHQIARVLRDFPSSELLEQYAADVEHLGFSPMQGFLKGFIDLVFQHAGRWYLVDYKTNLLGTTYMDYRPEALALDMAKNHYFLQYHLYVVGLHRYLAQRIADYDYGKHFGGVYYLYVRGMQVNSGRQFGVFYERPPFERIDALSGVLHAQNVGVAS